MHDLEEARSLLEPLEAPIVDSYHAAAKIYADLAPTVSLPLDTTARANVIHCHFCNEIGKRVDDGIPGVKVRPTESLRFYALSVSDEILLRFKFVGHGLPNNYPTRQQRLLKGQKYSEEMMDRLSLDGIANPPTLLTAGYTLDGLSIGLIEVRCDCVPLQSWSYSIYGDEAFVEPLTIPGVPKPALPAVVTSQSEKAKPERQRTKDVG
jgi:hypothetical protein